MGANACLIVAIESGKRPSSAVYPAEGGLVLHLGPMPGTGRSQSWRRGATTALPGQGHARLTGGFRLVEIANAVIPIPAWAS